MLQSRPECGGELHTRKSQPDEAKDFDGNPTTDRVPRFDAGMGVVSPYDWFPAGNGRLDPDGKVRSWTIERIVSRDWVAQHFRNGPKVREDGSGDDDIAKIALWHPAGNEDGSFITLRGQDGRRLKDMTVYREFYREPYWDWENDSDRNDEKAERKLFERGRWCATAGDQLLFDTTALMAEDARRLLDHLHIGLRAVGDRKSVV